MTTVDLTKFVLCLICSKNTEITSCANIFYISLPKSGELLANFVLRIIHLDITDLQSSYACSKCFKLFQILEQAQWTASNIQSEILKVYNSKKKEIIQVSQTNASICSENENGNENIESINGLNELNSIDSFELLNAEANNILENHSIDFTTDEKKEFPKSNTILAHMIHKKSDNFKISTENKRSIIVNTKSIENNELINFSNFIKPENNLRNSNDHSEVLESNELYFPEQFLNSTNSERNNIMLKSSQKSLNHSCSICGKRWKTTSELKNHFKSHLNIHPYMCEICGKSYKYKNALDIHIGMHNGINPFQCNLCNKCFTQKGALMRHLPIHTGEMPYQCDICGKRFVHHTSYNMHLLSHTGKKNYQCLVCDLTLLSTSHLKRHMKAHTGEKPFNCDFCEKKFAERYNLLAHQKIHQTNGIEDKNTNNVYNQ